MSMREGITPEIEDETLNELRSVLENNGWTHTKEEHGSFFERNYTIEGHPALIQTDWQQAISIFKEEHDIAEETEEIVASSSEEAILVRARCNTHNREQLMRTLGLDQHLRLWGFEEREMSQRTLRTEAPKGFAA